MSTANTISSKKRVKQAKVSDSKSQEQELPSVPGNRKYIYVGLVIVGLSIDLLTKHWAFITLKLGESYWLSDQFFGFTPNLNRGALWGIGQGQTVLFVVMSIFALVFTLVWLFWYKAAESLWITISLGLICSGTLGNLYDRLGIPGIMINGELEYAVRDFLDFRYIEWPIFNMADVFLVSGAFMLAWYTFFLEEPKKVAETQASK